MPEFGDPYMLEEYTLEDLKQCPILVWVSHETDSGEKPFLTPLLNTRISALNSTTPKFCSVWLVLRCMPRPATIRWIVRSTRY